eukprot:TRINITY_DN28062_c0_g1_i1.p1 TRINITY_DN28062_c0_g1~~TRINITY_DN28062_c0_g1_i1.p1  ORF type:complete len:479 (-),score=31.74 TRINITY_DN28062_c0_g1_i1:459-1754(-)
MEAIKRCTAASCRLGFRMRRSSDAGCRREVRLAQKAVDETCRVIRASIHMSSEARMQGHLDDLLSSLMQRSPVTHQAEVSMPLKVESETQTDHLLRRQVHALTSSKATENPCSDLPERFELRLMVTGPELDNSMGVITCDDSQLKTKIAVKNMDLCFGERLWSSRQLYAGPSVVCRLSTQEILGMSKRILAARGEHSRGVDWDDGRSEASTEDASSLGYTSSAELSGFDSDPPHSDGAAQGTLPRRRFARARRSTGSAVPHKNDAVTNAGTGTNACDTLPTLAEEDGDPVRLTPLKIYCFKHTSEYLQTRGACRVLEEEPDPLPSTRLKVYSFRHTTEYVQDRTCCCGAFWHDLSERYEGLLVKFTAKHGDQLVAALELERFFERKAQFSGCEGFKGKLFLRHHHKQDLWGLGREPTRLHTLAEATKEPGP